MNKLSFLVEAREQIAEGNTDKAIEIIKSFLAGNPTYKKLYTEALHLSSLFSKTKIDQSTRTISFDNAELNYGQVRQGLFNLLDFIERDDFNPKGLLSENTDSKQTSLNNRWMLIIGLPLLLLSGVILVLVTKTNNDKEDLPVKTNPQDCFVNFKDTLSPNFLILPFYKPSGGDAKPEGLVIDRLAEFCMGFETLKNADFEICDGFTPDRTLSFEDGAKKGIENNATIAIWGLLDESGTKKLVKTRFKYLGNKDIDGKVPFTQMNHAANIKDQGEQMVVTENVLSIIASSGELTQDLENTLKLLVGMVAQLEGNHDGAISAMHSADLTDTAANVMKYMVLADNFIAKNELEKAKIALDTCLNFNKNYWLGRNNRANLRINAGDYKGAIEDLNVALAKRPEDVDLLMTRGIAYQKANKTEEAKRDFDKVIKLKPEKAKSIKVIISKSEANEGIKRISIPINTQ